MGDRWNGPGHRARSRPDLSRGDFYYVGPATGGFVPISATSGQAASAFPMVNGAVSSCASDGAGGWYIGGKFDRVGGLARANLAHILADGRVDAAWSPSANDEVLTMAVSGGLVYAGGKFTSIGGQARYRLAAMDCASGALAATR